MIVDSTRKGKRFPDSMSKTIPIWTCVLNRAILNYRSRLAGAVVPTEGESEASDQNSNGTMQQSADWDSSLHLPLWVPDTEKAAIGDRLYEWTSQLEASGADIASLSSSLKKPLRPLWISQKTVIWLNEVPDHDSWDFTPIILISASSSSGVCPLKTCFEFSWKYIPGAGDDEESWARGLNPAFFWKNVCDIINSGPDMCNQKVASIVESDRVCRAQRGQNAPQISKKPWKSTVGIGLAPLRQTALEFESRSVENDKKILGNGCGILWLGSTNLAVCATGSVAEVPLVDSILNCDHECDLTIDEKNEAYLALSIVSSKFDRFSLLRNLPSALDFAKKALTRGKRLAVCCNNGEDISICVCLAILASLFSAEGVFDYGKHFKETSITKLEMRQRLVFICKFAVNAKPSRGNLKQVFNFLRVGSAAFS